MEGSGKSLIIGLPAGQVSGNVLLQGAAGMILLGLLDRKASSASKDHRLDIIFLL